MRVATHRGAMKPVVPHDATFRLALSLDRINAPSASLWKKFSRKGFPSVQGE